MATGGFRNLLWFMGVVEDREDPRHMGRIKVRCFDIHPDDKNLVPTADLPWAIPIVHDLNYKPPLTGTWVFGFFLDGEDAQHPMVIGVMPGMPTTIADNKNAYSGSDYNPKAADLYQPDISRLARAENIEETYVIRRYVNQEENLGYTWGEPDPSYNAKYPYNKVQETESGHIMEFDDTPASERINIEHRTGTFLEMMPNGSQLNKVMGDRYTITEMNDKVIVKGNVDVVIKGARTVNIEGHCNLTVDGDMKTTVHGNYDLDVAGTIQINSANYMKMKSSSIFQEAYLGSINSYAKVNHHMEAKDNITIHANTGILWAYANNDIRIQTDTDLGVYVNGSTYILTEGNTNLITNGNFYSTTTLETHIKSAGDVAIEGSRVDINTDGAAANATYDSWIDVYDPELPTYVTSSKQYDSNPSLRSLLGDPPIKKFASIKTLTPTGYTKFTDSILITEDEHGIEV